MVEEVSRLLGINDLLGCMTTPWHIFVYTHTHRQKEGGRKRERGRVVGGERFVRDFRDFLYAKSSSCLEVSNNQDSQAIQCLRSKTLKNFLARLVLAVPL